jgi:hypothetical protein
MNFLSKRIVLLVGLSSLPVFASANCGQIPQMPEIFNSQQLTIPQLEPMEEVFNGYMVSLEQFTACVDQEMGQLDHEAENYQEIFDLYIELHQNIERAKTISIDRYNFLLEFAVDEVPEEDDTQNAAENLNPEDAG